MALIADPQVDDVLHNTRSLIYLHIPKTGGVWVRHAMQSANLATMALGHQHCHFPQLLQMHNEDWYKRHVIFTMVRHPITWYQSRWTFRMKHGWRMGHPLDYHCASNDFHVFLDKALQYKPDGWVTWLYDQYIQNVPGKIDHVARLEYCIDDTIRIFNEAGIRFDEEKIRSIPRVNNSDMGGFSSKYWATYTPELLDRVMAVESKVIDRYYPEFQVDPNTLCGPRPW